MLQVSTMGFLGQIRDFHSMGEPLDVRTMPVTKKASTNFMRIKTTGEWPPHRSNRPWVLKKKMHNGFYKGKTVNTFRKKYPES